MPKRSSKDINQLAASIVERSTRAQGQIFINTAEVAPGSELLEKNPAAVALGKLGGLKGGKARAASLSPLRRKRIASAAAKARWKKRQKKTR